MDLEKQVIQSNQDLHVCGYMVVGVYMGAKLILLLLLANIPLFLELGNNFVGQHGLSLFFLFFRHASKYPLF
jgi:hypothetical protein